MHIKRHVLVLIATEPIDVETLLRQQKGIEDLIHEELDIGHDDIEYVIVDKKISGNDVPFRGIGKTLPAAIANFVHNAFNSIWYKPFRHTNREERDYLKKLKDSIPDGQASPL